ncbi:hypothetical protein DFH08DRAFT_811834 [Mycena albidolilacea]|uniref:Uncharacterized protein n=1 Tax=Mycena albidolilacea TaxID=1033008 RepID=A0AAD6ZV75_9AGAR|nr:hypothetical protein DFH08DRAFT_811834 [Mycena albidolilacea]
MSKKTPSDLRKQLSTFSLSLPPSTSPEPSIAESDEPPDPGPHRVLMLDEIVVEKRSTARRQGYRSATVQMQWQRNDQHCALQRSGVGTGFAACVRRAKRGVRHQLDTAQHFFGVTVRQPSLPSKWLCLPAPFSAFASSQMKPLIARNTLLLSALVSETSKFIDQQIFDTITCQSVWSIPSEKFMVPSLFWNLMENKGILLM